MAQLSIKMLTITALMGTSLSGCALIGGAADSAWSGTKHVARFVSTPVRVLLRDAPEQDTQFAQLATETEIETEIQTVQHTVVMTEDVNILDQDKIDMMAETVVMVGETQVLGATTAPMPIPPSMSGTTAYTSTISSWESAASTQQSVEIVETLGVSDFDSVDVVTVGPVSYVRMDGAGSLEDWRTCDAEAGGYWTFDTADRIGTLNPKFETCMQTKNYVQDTQLDAEMITKLEVVAPGAALKPLP